MLLLGLGNDDLWKADPGEEHEFHVEDNPFAFSQGQLSKLFNPKSLAAFYVLGGLRGLVLGMRTDSASGLSLDETVLDETVEVDEVTVPAGSVFPRGLVRPAASSSIRHTSSERYVDRKRVFDVNRLPEKKAKNLLAIMWITFNDKVLIILTIVATISLGLGLYQDFGQPDRYRGPKVRWVEGVTILVAVAIVVVVGSLNDYQKERQFIKLNEKKKDRVIKAIRSGKTVQISVYDILAGDVLHLEAGDLVPADGVFISGHNVKCDESSATGESDLMKKTPGDEVMARIEAGANANKLDPFIISGSKVAEGVGTYLVTGVGVHSSYGKLMVAMTDDTEATPTPLQLKLTVMAERITKLGCAAALLLFNVLFITFLAQLRRDPGSPAQKAQNFLQIVIVAITVIVIAVPEGLPLAVTLALAFAMTRMLKDHNLVRVLSSCETMGNATTILSDKTGTLTMNKMTVVVGSLGTACQFGAPKETTNQDQGDGERGASGNNRGVSFSEFASLLSTEARDILLQSIAVNSTAFEGEEDGKHTFIGSKTETALLSFAREHLGMGPINVERKNVNVVQMFPFDSSRKCMASAIRLSNGTYRMYVKGASEILLDKCSRIVADATKSIYDIELTKDNHDLLTNTVDNYAVKSLRTISMVYRDFGSWPPPGAKTVEDDPREAVFEDIFKDMVFLGIVGIQDPLRPGVKEAITQCQRAGVVVKMITGDNIGTAKAIAEECGIYTPGGVIMEGPQFRRLSENEMDQVIPQLQVLARSSPEDKRILVRRSKELGETVAVTGDGTNDGPALRAADIGFSMGIAGTEVAKEASSIILMDDNFSSIVKALEWGRAVNDAVKKFLQFQLTVNITAVGITFVSAIANPNQDPILTPVQLLWVNLIMDTFAALALATDPPPPSILDRKPDPKSAPLITLNMWKMIIGQSIYQLIVILTLNFAGNEILGYKTEYEKSWLETLIFNIFVWMQIFNQLK